MNKKKYKCGLFPYERKDCFSLQEAKQNAGWNITAFNLPKAWEFSQGEGVTIAVLDSTPSWSPIICKNASSKDLEILTIEEIFENYGIGEVLTTEKGEEIKHIENLYVWNGHSKSDKKWQKIKYAIRHSYTGEILRINTGSGLVDVTPNHSVIGANGKELDAKSLKIGQKVAHCSPHLISKTNGLFFMGSKDLAWAIGLWTAEGSIYKTKSAPYVVTWLNSNKELLEKTLEIILSNFNIHGRIDSDSKGMFKLVVQNRGLFNYIKKNCIWKGEKRVPNTIFNAPNNVKLEFLKGYNLGDGYNKICNKLPYEFKCFTTKSQILGAGLYLLATMVLPEQTKNIYTRNDKQNIIQISFNAPNSDAKQKRHKAEIKKIMSINYEGFVYDLETEDHTFGCGIGPIRLHNTGCDIDHPDLVENLLPGMNFVTPGKPPIDGNGHGTHVTGTLVAANNDIGVVGVCPKAKVRPVKVLADDGNGNLLNVVKGIRWAIEQKVDLISMSLGAPFPVQEVRKAIQAAQAAGIVCFVAAGNAGNTKDVFYPAAYPETIAVGAIDINMRRASFSNTGKNLDFMAPGVDIFSTVPDDWYATLSGTSMAQPFLCGVGALLLSYVRNKRPDIKLTNNKDYVEIFKKYTIPVKGDVYEQEHFYQGFGIIDPQKFIESMSQQS